MLPEPSTPEPSRLDRFASLYEFDLDRFQLDALQALDRGESVLVAAPTGSGKTVVGEFAIWLALEEGKKAFYTTPLKALSNQKFGDLAKLAGADNVGLLTGDNSINPHASVLVMTTEVLRNMIYERSDLLADLSHVVLDEVHYLQDPYRGAVWEEVIIHLPQEVKIVSLSATVSNAEEFSDWIQTLRGPTKAVIETRRPVELKAHCLIDRTLYPMFTTIDGQLQPNAEIARAEAKKVFREDKRPRSRGRAYRPRPRFADRAQTVEVLRRDQMLPAIYFIFSRKGCSLAVAACIRKGLVLTDSAERAEITRLARERCAYLDPEDLDVLGYSEWLDALCNGIAAHHAGMIPVFKEAVEELFQRGLIKVVFATETLSLGINMPARTVVIESLSKFSGERHEILTPGEFTQLTGRAGRRGIDEIGHAVVPAQRDIPFHQVAALASATTYPLLSSFQPSYNMATNLIRNYSREQAHHLLNSSFAQYRADKDVAVLKQRLSRRFERILKILEGYSYVEDFELSDKGCVLAKIYNENDLLVTETVNRGWLLGLKAQELAALISTFVFQSRGPFELEGDLPSAASKKVYGKIARLSDKIKAHEASLGLQMTRGVEPGFAHYVYRWCMGDALEDVIDEETTPGDFIRSCKQTLDLLRQLRGVEGDPALLGNRLISLTAA